jgi:ribosomal protein RSM22 (predicted rRNA methylase)
MDVRVPEALRAAIEALQVGPGRAVSRHAAELSAAYRTMQPSRQAVTGAADIAAYLAARMPATYAAVARVLDEALARLPGFSPQTVLDAGAGPGTASWAVGEAFGEIAAFTLLDHNSGFLDIAQSLAAHSGSMALMGAERIRGSLAAPGLGARHFDLVMTSYALTELPDASIVEAALALWDRCDGALIIVEPGRTRDYQRLMAVRQALLGAGAQIVAPCPHADACPLPDGDWCHFSVRLPRSRAHKQAKSASLAYEDEKFSYLILARPGLIVDPVPARVIRQPEVKKFEVALALCTSAGLQDRSILKRDAAGFKLAKKLDWGDGTEEA